VVGGLALVSVVGGVLVARDRGQPQHVLPPSVPAFAEPSALPQADPPPAPVQPQSASPAPAAGLGAHALPAAWCAGPLPLQASAIDDDTGRLVPLPVDPVGCVIHVGAAGADARAGAPVNGVSLYRPGFRPVGVYLADVGADGQGWPTPTPLSGPLIGCPGEPGVVVAQVETAAVIEPLERLCLGLCVPVAPLVADPERCGAVASAVAKLSELPLLWEIVSLRGRAAAGGAW
jgi:hypothetical protein